MIDDAGLRILRQKRGAMADLARYLGVSPSTVRMWRKVPAELVVDVEACTGVPRETLRPDLYVGYQAATHARSCRR